jgi:hypothetical protein
VSARVVLDGIRVLADRHSRDGMTVVEVGDREHVVGAGRVRAAPFAVER